MIGQRNGRKRKNRDGLERQATDNHQERVMGLPARHSLKINFDLGEAGEKEIDFEVLYDENGVEIIKGEIGERDALWLFVGPQRKALEHDIIDAIEAMEPDFVIPEYMEAA